MKPFFRQQPMFQLYRAWSNANPMFLRLGEGRFNITRREWRILATLAIFNRLSSSDLAKAAELDPVRTSRTVTRLVEKGWVSRHKNKENARSVWVQIEAEGIQLYETMMPLVIEMNQMLTADLSEQELQVLEKALDKITQRAVEMNASEMIPERARRGGRDASSGTS